MVLGVRGDIADEGAVDLHPVDGECLQVMEGGEAGAEVVERHLAAERPERRDDARRLPKSSSATLQPSALSAATERDVSPMSCNAAVSVISPMSLVARSRPSFRRADTPRTHHP